MFTQEQMRLMTEDKKTDVDGCSENEYVNFTSGEEEKEEVKFERSRRNSWQLLDTQEP